VALAVALLGRRVQAQWADDFESYAPRHPACTAWAAGTGWNNDPAATAYVADRYAHGGDELRRDH
jgi:hypothetical protein